jgi:hypothetical protein
MKGQFLWSIAAQYTSGKSFLQKKLKSSKNAALDKFDILKYL